MSNCKEQLFTEFKAPTRQEWLDKIQVDLKGADFNKRLVWRTNEGFNVQPFYLKEDLENLKTPDSLPGEFPFVRGNKKGDNAWYVRQRIMADDAAAANEKALDILNRGVDSLSFKIPGKNISKDFVETLLKGIECEAVELNFNTCKRHTLELAKILDGYFTAKGYDKTKIVGSFNWDPMEKIVVKGLDTVALLAQAPQIVEAMKEYPNFRTICVNAVALNNNGAYIVQELGYALAWGNEYMNQLVEAGTDADEAAKNIKFNLGISENFFMEMAKFRAARMLWAEIVKQYAPKDDASCMMCVNAATSKYNMTMFDSYVNMLRSQTEAMSAALAGVHSIEVLPFDAVYETPNEFSERIARNQQLLLKEESHFDKVVDPEQEATSSKSSPHRSPTRPGRSSSTWKTTVDSWRLQRRESCRTTSTPQTPSATTLPQRERNSYWVQTSSLTSRRKAKESAQRTHAADALTRAHTRKPSRL